MRRLRLPILLLLLTACPQPDDDGADDDDSAVVDDDDTSDDDDDGPGGGTIHVEPEVLDFGEVLAGQTAPLGLLLANVGGDGLQIQDILLSNAAALTLTNQGEVDLILGPGQSTVVEVTYSPVQAEEIEATLTIRSNDDGSPEVVVPVLGTGLAPAVGVQPGSFDFGNLQLGCTAEMQVSFTNGGSLPATVEAIWYEDLSGSGELAMTSTHAPPLVLDPGESISVDIGYVPVDVEPDAGIVHVLTDTPTEPIGGATGHQFGIAHLGPSMTDSFAQGDPQLDTFPLSGSPIEASVQVSIDTAQITSGWNYEASLNAVVFATVHVPAVGATVEITWLELGCAD